MSRFLVIDKIIDKNIVQIHQLEQSGGGDRRQQSPVHDYQKRMSTLQTDDNER